MINNEYQNSQGSCDCVKQENLDPEIIKKFRFTQICLREFLQDSGHYYDWYNVALILMQIIIDHDLKDKVPQKEIQEIVNLCHDVLNFNNHYMEIKKEVLSFTTSKDIIPTSESQEMLFYPANNINNNKN